MATDEKAGLWEGHQGEDYTVVMAPGETTENTSITISSGDMKADDELACRLVAFLNGDDPPRRKR